MKVLAIATCCAACVMGLAVFDVGCSMWFRPLGFMFAGLEVAAVALFIGRSASDWRD